MALYGACCEYVSALFIMRSCYSADKRGLNLLFKLKTEGLRLLRNMYQLDHTIFGRYKHAELKKAASMQ